MLSTLAFISVALARSPLPVCTLSDGRTVKRVGWAGYDVGPNHCNKCRCLGPEALACTKKFCLDDKPDKCDPSLMCGEALTCVKGQLYPTTCGPKNCDEPIGASCSRPEDNCDSSLVCGDALTCVHGKLYPTTCGPRNCDKPIGPCKKPEDPCADATCPAVVCEDGSEPPKRDGECCGDVNLCPGEISLFCSGKECGEPCFEDAVCDGLGSCVPGKKELICELEMPGCTLSDGETKVPLGWSGKDKGDNSCNSCSCMAPDMLTCTMMFCLPDLPEGTCTLSDEETVVPVGWNGNDAGDNSCNRCRCIEDDVLACTRKACNTSKRGCSDAKNGRQCKNTTKCIWAKKKKACKDTECERHTKPKKCRKIKGCSWNRSAKACEESA